MLQSSTTWSFTMKKMLLASSLFGVLSIASAQAFEITSPDVSEGGTMKMEQIANGFGCTGGGLSPALSWKDVPEGTKSFAISMYDPDAPSGSGFWHWVAFDIPATTTSLAAGAGNPDGKSMPEGTIQSGADANVPGYVGACPPPGAPHHYIITLKALKVDKLGLDTNASGAMVGFMTNANKLGEATITATYGR
jgi:Raf kinase inhibitor-like YbhB/YbcL family protein